MCEGELVNIIQLELLEKNEKKLTLKKISVVFVIVNNKKKVNKLYVFFFIQNNKVRRESYLFINKSKGEKL